MDTEGKRGLRLSARAVREIAAQYAVFGINLAYPAIFAGLINIVYGSEAYGRSTPLIALCATLFLITDFGAQISAPKIIGRISSERHAARRACALIIFRSACSILLVIPAGLAFLLFYTPGFNLQYIVLYVFSAAIAGAWSPSFYYLTMGKMAEYSRIVFFVRLSILVVIMTVAALGGELDIVLGLYLVAPLLLSVIALAHLNFRDEMLRINRSLVIQVGKKSWVLGSSVVAANTATTLPFFLVAPWLSPVSLGWLHLGAMFSRAAASTAEPIGMALYINAMRHPNRSETMTLLWWVQFALGAGLSVAAWVAAEAMLRWYPNNLSEMTAVFPLFLLPMIITWSHLCAISVLRKPGGQKIHLYANLSALIVGAGGAWMGSKFLHNAEVVAWIIVLGEVAGFAILLANAKKFAFARN